MKKTDPHVCLFVLLILICLISGCATIGQGVGGLFNLVGGIIGGVFKLVGKALDVAASLPKPPPGVF